MKTKTVGTGSLVWFELTLPFLPHMQEEEGNVDVWFDKENESESGLVNNTIVANSIH